MSNAMPSLHRSRSFLFLVSLLALVLFHPLLAVLPVYWADFLGSILFTVVMLAGVWWASAESRRRVPAVLLLLPGLGALWFRLEIGALAPLVWTTFCFYTAVLLFAAVLRPGEELLDRIFAAISVYLLIGISFGYLHQVVLALDPESYRLPIAIAGDGSTDMLYFSFVTLMTLGFGDVIPLSPFARMLTVTESLVGVFFVAVLIARLISLRDAPAEGGPDDTSA